MKRPSIHHSLILFATLLAILGWFFQDVLLHPGDTLFGKEGDSIKNYYTPWYHIKHDSTYGWFEGMNYPYGEHPVYADAQPVLSNSLKWFSQNIVDVSDQVPGILNVLMLFSLLPGAWFVWLILRRMGVPDLPSAFMAVSLILLSPQIYRMNGHYALAYTFVVPMIWYLIMRFRENASPVWAGILIVTALLLAGLHPYYLMIYAIFVGSVGLFDVILGKKDLQWKRRTIWVIVQLILPVLLFKVYLSLTDPVADRPANPYGFMAYTSSWKSVFLPYAYPFIQTARKSIGMGPVHPEGLAYVGIAGLIFLVALITHGIQSIRKRRWQALPHLTNNRENRIYLLSCVLIFLFASGYLFPGVVGEWVGSLPFLSQFRSTGRFAWVFYYIWGILGWKYIWELLVVWQPQGRHIKLGLTALFVGMIVVDNGYYLHFMRTEIIPSHSLSALKKQANAMLPAGFNTQPFDALITTPYYHIGSENFSSRRRAGMGPEFLLSLREGKPLMNASLSRTSFSQSWKLIQFPLQPLVQPEILADLPPNARILNLQHREAERKQMEIPWISQVDSLFRMPKWTGFELRPQQVAPQQHFRKWAQDHCQPDTSSADSMIPSAAFEAIWQPDFQLVPPPEGSDKFDLFTLPPTGRDSIDLQISIWVKMHRDQIPVSRLWARQRSPEGEKLLEKRFFVQAWPKAIIDQWVLIEIPLEVPHGHLSTQLQWHAYGDWQGYLEFRSLLIREKNQHICQEISGNTVWNNYLPAHFFAPTYKH